ncbi:ATP-binding cassette domain-containing protein [Falsirhodobacter xinxiangensis]|uniref:ATP-binding cassette domain-containing protein n=1 Tax=Falsirhodobacter xinxiangensis TaxID=2530049 RepID=UPI0010A99C12|nr:ATP-binding cassette domain-containing protein [Rhodobacter xinxiangensis]
MLNVENLGIGFSRYTGLLRQEEMTRLSGVSFDLCEGEVLAVIGGSGAGKSLLAHALLGLLPPNATLRGTMSFRGRSMTPYPASLRGRRIALMAQQVSHLDPLARLGAQTRWAARRTGAAKVPDLQTLGLGPETCRLYPGQLSGGMARRALFALAGVGQPDLLIADEPTAGLDPENRDRLLALLQAHAHRGGAVILITHDLMPALPVADRVMILDEGHMCGFESSRDFKGDGMALTSPYAHALWRALPENAFLTDA